MAKDRGAARPWLVDLAEREAYEVLVNALGEYASTLRHQAESDSAAGADHGGSTIRYAERADELLEEIEKALDG